MIIAIPENVSTIMNRLQAEGYQAFVYGACIRDSLLGINPINWDITTDALAPDIVLLFDDRDGFTAIPSAHDDYSVTLIYQEESYRLNTFRTGQEHRFSDDIREELKHHDFTINSIAYNPEQGLIDVFGGVQDIENRIIKCAGDPAIRLREDSVRVLRAVRFEAQLGFVIDASLLQLLSTLEDTFDFYHSEKVCNEITQMLLDEQPSTSIRRLLELDLLQHLIPELIPTVGFDTHSSFHDNNVFDHTMMVLDHTKPNLTLRLAALFHDIDKPNCLTIDSSGEGHCYGHANSGSQVARAVLTRLNFDLKTVNGVCALIKEHMNCYDNTTELSIKRLIRRVGPDNIDNLFELQLADSLGSESSGRDIVRVGSIRNKCWEVLSRKEPLTTHDLDISGFDLMAFYSSGKEMGEALEFLLDKVVDNPSLNNREALLALLVSNYRNRIRDN